MATTAEIYIQNTKLRIITVNVGIIVKTNSAKVYNLCINSNKKQKDLFGCIQRELSKYTKHSNGNVIFGERSYAFNANDVQADMISLNSLKTLEEEIMATYKFVKLKRTNYNKIDDATMRIEFKIVLAKPVRKLKVFDINSDIAQEFSKGGFINSIIFCIKVTTKVTNLDNIWDEELPEGENIVNNLADLVIED